MPSFSHDHRDAAPRRRALARRATAATAALAAGALILTGCGSSTGEAGSGAATGVVNVVSPAQPESLDPQISTDSIMAEITLPVYETLVTVDSDLAVQPMLAESFERSEDGLEYTFMLRKGVKFQDGSDLDADDVVASMNRWDRVSIAAQEAFAGAEWTKVDDLTVTLTVPSASFLHLLYLSNVTTAYSAILPSEVIEKVGDNPIEDLADFIGTGPYKIASWDADQSIVIEKWDDYQPRAEASSGFAGAKEATLDQVIFSFVPDASTRSLGILSGQYDATTELPFDSLDQFTEDPNLVLGTYLVGPINLVYSDDPASLFSKVENRQAVNTALDRDPIMLGAVGSADLYDLVHHNMTREKEPIWNTEIGKADFNQHDVEKAKKMLADGGYTGQPVRLLANKDYTEAYNSAVVVAEQLKGLGMDVTLDAYEWGAFSEKWREQRDEWDLVVFPFSSEVDPTQTIGFLPGRAGYFDGPELQELLTRFRAAPTQEDASMIYDDMQTYIEKTRPMSRIGDAHNVYAAKKGLDLPWFSEHFVWWNAGWAKSS
ncbi:ABC transporter substrate-binding protein [Glaciibacter psychrotolerans]|uniref:Peptide/nickel transport system substrate-binding protein n=1 Tax=Glaciibacter psychrotolerans TaxID=670054 RepID=A0A7Z0ECC9_9MICO|nr:ABC transporter substrate-binding protein [Leifsonia psychrotolerans]NYJ18580.1 peptide/nickel transport system substrate-binding protein [Leifsonia psychrotolerans]